MQTGIKEHAANEPLSSSELVEEVPLAGLSFINNARRWFGPTTDAYKHSLLQLIANIAALSFWFARKRLSLAKTMSFMKPTDIVARLQRSKVPDAQVVADAIREITALRSTVAELERLVFTTAEKPDPPPRKRRKAPKFPRGTPVKERMLDQIEIDPGTGCWNWLGTGSRFYPSITDDNGLRAYPHKLMYEIQVGYKFKKGEEALHSCDNTWCINPDHIRPGTHRENMEDRSNKDRSGMAKVTREQAKEIRRRYHQGESAAKLARAFGVTEGHAWKIAVNAVLRDRSGKEVSIQGKQRSGRERQSTLTVEDVRDIKKRLRRGERPKDIGAIYNVASYNISNIKHRKRWANVR